MGKNAFVKITTVIILITAFLICCVTYTGRISVKGNEPHTYTVLITFDNVEYRITGSLEELIYREYQNKIITVKGKIVKEAVGPGMPAELQVEEIIKVEDG